MNQFLLFTPGPVNVARNVRLAISKDDICHREPDFDDLMESVEDKLLALFGIEDRAHYRAVVITGSGTAANEAILSSVVGDKKVLVLSNGEFGERLHKISSIHNKNTVLLDFPWGKSLDLDVVEAYLKNHRIDVVAMVHHETCSGMLNPLEDIGALAKSNGALFVVDCVSSAGAEIIDMEACNIAFCSSSSSKAIGAHAGLSFVIGKAHEFEKLKHNPVKTTYLNLATFYAFLIERSQTPNTPAVPLFYGLEQALANILNEGVANRFSKIRERAGLLRQGMLKLGLRFLIDQKDMCSVLTTVVLPPNVDVDDLRRKLRENSIIVYEGKGCFKNKVFQVGNIGELSNGDIRLFLGALGEILKESLPVDKANILSIRKPKAVGLPGRGAAAALVAAGI